MMTKKEFLKLVDDKIVETAGALTPEDVLELGIAHRELPKAERNWAELADLISWSGSSESLRNFIIRRLKARGELVSAVDLNDEESLIQKRQDLFKVRQQVRDERTSLNKS